jgi:hypothetical protein
MVKCLYHHDLKGNAVAQLVEALRYKPEGRGFDSRLCNWFNPLGRNKKSTQPLPEMYNRNIFWELKAAGACGWQIYHLHVPVVSIFGSLKLLEPSGSDQAFTEIALP